MENGDENFEPPPPPPHVSPGTYERIRPACHTDVELPLLPPEVPALAVLLELHTRLSQLLDEASLRRAHVLKHRERLDAAALSAKTSKVKEGKPFVDKTKKPRSVIVRTDDSPPPRRKKTPLPKASPKPHPHSTAVKKETAADVLRRIRADALREAEIQERDACERQDFETARPQGKNTSKSRTLLNQQAQHAGDGNGEDLGTTPGLKRKRSGHPRWPPKSKTKSGKRPRRGVHPLQSRVPGQPPGPSSFHQVPIQTFYASLESYFRPLTDDDFAWLETAVIDVDSLLFPTCGRHYRHVWAELDGHTDWTLENAGTSEQPAPSSSACGGAFVPAKTLEERLLCALAGEGIVPATDINVLLSGEAEDSKPAPVAEVRLDVDNQSEVIFPRQSDMECSPPVASVEERIIEELQYLGDVSEVQAGWYAAETDEVALLLRQHQRDLLAQLRLNRRRKDQLLTIALKHKALQSCQNVLSDLNQQLELAYLKRYAPEYMQQLAQKRKRQSESGRGLLPSDESVETILARRKQVVARFIGDLQPDRIPTSTVYGVPLLVE